MQHHIGRALALVILTALLFPFAAAADFNPVPILRTSAAHS